MESLTQLLNVCTRRTEDFIRHVDSTHLVWLAEIQEAARNMFSSDFTAEPELMPKTPSQKRRRKKRTSIVPDENRDIGGRRISRRRSSASWSSSVRRLSTKQLTKPLNDSIQEESAQPKRLTRARAQASAVCMPSSEKPLEEIDDRVLQVNISAEERRSAELQLSENVALEADLEAVPDVSETVTKTAAPQISTEPSAPITPEKNNRAATKLKIADSSTPKRAAEDVVDMICSSPPEATGDAAKLLALEFSGHSLTPTGPKSDRRSVRRSIVGRKSISCRPSLANQYSLAKKRESMTREAVRKSIRRSIAKKKATESSSSSYRSYQNSIEVVDDEISIKIRPEVDEPAVEEQSPDSPRRSLPKRTCKKIPITNLPEAEEPVRMATRLSLRSSGGSSQEIDDQTIRRKSYKRAVDELSDNECPDDDRVHSPPRKKSLSPTCPPSKVVKPTPAHLRSFLHTVQKNQLLMMTPGSISKTLMVKSFIKRNTPLKTDPKEKERQRLEALRKREEAELQRKQKIEESKKRKQEELKLKREERLRKVLQARERVEQLEEEKKKKMEQKFAQIDEKTEKVREDRIAEEKAKKKMTAKKQEDVESRRRQEEDARKLKAKQLEEEERRQQELLQKKREEEEQERQRRFAEAKKLAEARQAEQERERQRLQQLAAEREQERLQAERERERMEKEKALQRELERAAQLKEQQRREAEESRRKEQQERLEQERLRREMEAKRLLEEQQRLAKEKQTAATTPALNVTVDIQNSPVCESYEMTPKGYKPNPPKFNPEDYGMDLNSDDSTDDESRPRKPIPAWASGSQLSQAIHQQYHRPISVNKAFGKIDSPNLELLFSKSKPRYYKRTSSAVWHSPPLNSHRQHLAVGYGLKKY